MRLVSKPGKFIAESTYEERDIPKRAGFHWDRNGKHWYTRDSAQASKLIEYADDETRAALAGVAKEREAAIEQSKAASADISIPAPDGCEYLPFQRAGIAYACQRNSAMIADEMGLGKTIQAIGVINADEAIRSVLVICPASLKLNWRQEMRKWLVRPLKVEIASGIFPTAEIADVVIVNYDVLHKNSAKIREREWDIIILDESHYAKNPKAARTKEIVGDGKWNRSTRSVDYKIKPLHARRKLALTGTPILNRPIEIQPVAGWLCPGQFGSFWSFAKRYADAHQNRYGWDLSGASHLDELQEKLRASIMVRRLKKDVLTELPPKRRQILEVASNGAAGIVAEEARTYERHEDELEKLRAVVELSKVSADPADYETAVRNLREAAHAAFTEMSIIRHQVAVAKIPAVVDHAKETLENITKLVIFCHHHDVVNGLMEGLAEFDPVKLTGEMNQGDRQLSVDRFQRDDSCRVFIGSIHAAGVGLTLTAASTVIFAELDWVPANMTQAEDRLHRIGQRDNVLVQHIVLQDSLDARMAKALVEKQNVADQALDREAAEIEEPIAPTPQSGNSHLSPRRKQLEEAAKNLTVEEIEQIHFNLRRLAGMCDFARSLDGAGFNKIDAHVGHSLAEAQSLTRLQAALGQKLCRKYRRQLDNG